MSERIPTVAAVIIHEVEDYDAWLEKFSAHQAVRQSAGIVGHHLNRGADNPNLVAVYLPATDAGQLQAFLANDELRAKMKDAGVKGTPSIKIMTPRSIDLDLSAAHAGMIVSHTVADYDAWRKAYDDFDAKRTELGITGHAVNVLADDGNTVIVYHQAQSVDTLKSFAQSDELESRMTEAGVTGKPDISFWNATPGVEY